MHPIWIFPFMLGTILGVSFAVLLCVNLIDIIVTRTGLIYKIGPAVKSVLKALEDFSRWDVDNKCFIGKGVVDEYSGVLVRFRYPNEAELYANYKEAPHSSIKLNKRESRLLYKKMKRVRAYAIKERARVNKLNREKEDLAAHNEDMELQRKIVSKVEGTKDNIVIDYMLNK